MKHLLFVCYGAGHAQTIAPIVKKMAVQTSKYKCTVLALTTAWQVMEANNIPYVQFSDFAHLFNDNVLELGQRLVGPLSQYKNHDLVSYEESIAYHGVNYNELIETHGEEQASKLYEEKQRQAFLPVNFMKKVLKDVDADILVSTNSPRTERAAIDAARLLNIPSVCIIDLFALQEIKWISKQGFASKLCVLNEQVKEMFMQYGRFDHEIVVTGNPAFDKLKIDNRDELRAQARARHGCEDKKVVLWASQVEPDRHPFTGEPGYPDLMMKIETALRAAVKARDDLHLIIRLHPSEERTVEQVQDRVTVSPNNEQLQSMLVACDCLISQTSTVAVEASLMGVHVGCVELSIFQDDARYSEYGLTKAISKIEDIEQSIYQMVDDGMEKSPDPNLGVFTDNVIKVIEELA